MDYGHAQADKTLQTLEKKLTTEYRKAHKEVSKKLLDYANYFVAEDKKRAKLVQNGKITKKQYQQWREQAIFQGKRWREMEESLANDLLNVDKIAQSMITDNAIDVYALNYNYGLYEVEKGINGFTGFALYDRNTVLALMRDNPRLLKPMGSTARQALAEGKIKRWNKQKLRSVAMQGILQGDSVPQIARRMADTLTVVNRASALRDARTMTTAAENMGRVESYKRAAELGIKLVKVWMATEDARTRLSHREMDGESAPVDKDFSNGLMFPGDPAGAAAEVYNCRCTLVTEIEDDQEVPTQINAEINEMDYDQWEKYKESVGPFESKKIKKTFRNDDKYNEFTETITNAPNRVIFDKLSEKPSYRKRKGGGSWMPSTHQLTWDYRNRNGMSEFSTFAHEFNHCADTLIDGRALGLHYNEADAIKDFLIGGDDKIGNALSSSDEFLKAIHDDVVNLRVSGNVADPDLRTQFYDEIKNSFKPDSVYGHRTAGIQDALDGAYGYRSLGKVYWGHGAKYYNREYSAVQRADNLLGGNRTASLKQAYQDLGFDASNQAKVKRLTRRYETASETWANIGSAVSVGGEELSAWIEYMPNTYKAYLDIIGRIK